MQKQLLQKQRALITGASSGIGEGIARAFASEGATVVVNYRSSREDADRIVAEIRQGGGHAVAMQADISNPEECERLFDDVCKELGGLDILVANAGIQRDAPFADMSLDDWKQVIDVNLTGQFICAQKAVRLFQRQQSNAQG